MATTLPADFAFVPKVWEDAVMAYFPKKLMFGAVAMQNNTLTQQPGTSINFPYFKTIGAASELLVTDDIVPDKMSDDSFSATVKEIGKGVAIRRGALMTSSQEQDVIFGEIQRQIARVMAEKVDADLITEVNTATSHVQGFSAAAAADKASVQNILKGLVTAFGDRQDEVVALYMHSQAYLNIVTDSTAGFLKADANDPFWNQPGFMGRLLGKAVFVTDQCPNGTAVDTKKTFHMFAVKANPYGIITKAAPMMEQDYDLLGREYLFTGTMWYAVKSFHSKVSADDKRVARLTFASDLASV